MLFSLHQHAVDAFAPATMAAPFVTPMDKP
jgi:hypothetical protein